MSHFTLRALTVGGLCAWLTVSSCALHQSTPEAPDKPAVSGFSVERELPVALRFAPIVYHGADKGGSVIRSTYDFLCPFDYDGDECTANNSDRIRNGEWREKIPATVYCSVLETETHWFITYHFYHIYDWSPIGNPLWLALEHENDGENIQLTVRKDSSENGGTLMLAALNKHASTYLFAPAGSSLSTPHVKGVLQSEDGRPVIYIAAGSHAVNAAGDKDVRYTPTGDAPDSWSQGRTSFAYTLRSIYTDLWVPYTQSRNLGDGGTLDGYFEYTSPSNPAFKNVKVPAFYDSDQLSLLFTWKKNAGVLPFRLGPSVAAKNDMGKYFFDPAYAYKRQGVVDPGGWSEVYSYHPYFLKQTADNDIESDIDSDEEGVI